MKNILVAVDFDGNTDLLIDKALELAKPFRSKIWIMHIAAPDPDFVGFKPGPRNVREFRAEELREEHKLIQSYAQKIQESGIDAEGLLVQGPTIETIIDESMKLNIDLIIAGYYNYGFFYKAIIGSVSSKIIKKSKIPVLIVPLE